MKKVFIHTNNKQHIGAVLGKFSIERKLPQDSDITVSIINVDSLPIFKTFAGKTYLRGGKEIVYDLNDLQSFTLSRFMPPEEMNFQGRALVIDPDIFAIGDITPLMNLDMQGCAIAACKKGDSWQSSSMLMDCSKLTHLKISDLLSKLEKKEVDPLLKSKSKALVRKYAQPTSIKKWSIDGDMYFLSTGFDIDIEHKYPDAFNHLLK